MKKFLIVLTITIGILIAAVTGWTFIRSRNIQEIAIAYQNPDGSYGSPHTVIKKGYNAGDRVHWKVSGDSTYEEAEVSYKVSGPRQTLLHVKRNKTTVDVSADSHISYSFYINGTLKNSSPLVVLVGSSYSITVTPDEGYEYAGMTSQGISSSLTGKIKKNTVIQLHSMKKRYKDTVSFSYGESYSFSAASGESFVLSDVVHADEDMNIKSVSIDNEKVDLSDSYKQPKKDITISVDAEQKKHHVIYNDAGDTNPNPETYTGTLELQEPSKKGYTFKYWKDSRGEKITELKGKDDELTAIWSKNITVTYMANDGTDSSQTSDSKTVEESMFSRSGYTFAEWNTESDGSGQSYHAGDTLSDSVTLYAVWKYESSYSSYNSQQNQLSSLTENENTGDTENNSSSGASENQSGASNGQNASSN